MGNLFGGKQEGTEITGAGTRIYNLFKYQGRGIIGTIPVLMLPIFLSPFDDLKKKPAKTALVIWLLMFSSLLIHPIKVSPIAFMPVFFFPVLHVMNSADVCQTFFSQNTALLVIGGYLRELINVSGADKRFILWMMFSDNNSSISNNKLIIKASLASYFLSMVSNRQRVVPYIMANVVKPLRTLESESNAEPNFAKLRHILSNAVVTSSVIGSMTIVNGARNVMFMRILWESSGHEDTFNFCDYFCFAFPTCLVLFVANLCYNLVCTSVSVGNQMSVQALTAYRSSVLSDRDFIPENWTCHEKLAILFSLGVNVAYMTRWGKVMKKLTNSHGWAVKPIPDVSAAVIFLALSAIIPIKCSAMQIFKAKTYSELPPVKADSSVLFWKQIDKGTHYGYMFLAGGFSALDAAVKATGAPNQYLHGSFSFITNMNDKMALLLMAFLSAFLCNIMTSVAAAGMSTILALNFIPTSKVGLIKKHYLFILTTGLATSFGFAAQFKNTPAASHATHEGLVQQIPFALGSIVICTMLLYVMIVFYAPMIFEY